VLGCKHQKPLRGLRPPQQTLNDYFCLAKQLLEDIMKKFALIAAVAVIALTTGQAFAGDNFLSPGGSATDATSNVDVNTGAFVDASDNSTYNGSDYGDLDVAVNSAFAPSLWATQDTCMGSSSVGGQAMLFGFSVGTTWRDEDCVRRKDARELFNMGNAPGFNALRTAGLARMCQKLANKSALHAAGLPCPGEGVTTAANTKVEGSQFFGLHFDNVIVGDVAQKPVPVVAAPRAVPVDSKARPLTTKELNEAQMAR
jgi:hypothetical protein